MKALIGHIILNVSDLNKSMPFYDAFLQQLGFKIVFKESEDWGGCVSYKQGDHNIWIKYEKSKKHKKFVRDVGLDHLAFRVLKKKQVDELFEIIKQHKVKITREPKNYPEYSKKYYAIYFRDPDNIPLEIFYK